jgi:hypothetical protein
LEWVYKIQLIRGMLDSKAPKTYVYKIIQITD